jgi:hypothetical protein
MTKLETFLLKVHSHTAQAQGCATCQEISREAGEMLEAKEQQSIEAMYGGDFS